MKRSTQLFALFGFIATTTMLSCDKASLPQVPGELQQAAKAAEGCDELAQGNIEGITLEGSAQANLKIKSFLNATYQLEFATTAFEQSIIDSCAELGLGLGLAKEDLDAKPEGGKGGEKVCGLVSAEIEKILTANAGAKLAVEITEPTCNVPVEAMLECYKGCGVTVSPGEFEASCKGGEISGQCSAECKGSCSVEAGAACTGSCQGSCSGSCQADFSGTCGGKCKGTCDGKKSKGKCEGTCEGSCDAQAEGNCGGTCEGTCSASCEVKAEASCSGTCSGGCSVDYEAPSCSGSFEPPSVDVSCQLECSAKAQAELKCEPPQVKLTVTGTQDESMKRLVAALQVSLPKIGKLQLASSKQLSALAKGVVDAGAAMGDAAASAGGKAIACVSASAKMATATSAALDIDIKASASVSTSLSASASGKAG